MYCINCGLKIKKDEHHCLRCGSKSIEKMDGLKFGNDGSVKNCPLCSKELERGSDKCSNCNAIISELAGIKTEKEKLGLELIFDQIYSYETDIDYAYGYKFPSLILFLPLVLLSIYYTVPGIIIAIISGILYFICKQHYIVVVTNSRIIMMNVRGNFKEVKDVSSARISRVKDYNIRKGLLNFRLSVQLGNNERKKVSIPEKARIISGQKRTVEKLVHLNRVMSK